MSSLVLSPEQRESELSLTLREIIVDRIVNLRTRNDGDLSDVQTARLRGQINEQKWFLELLSPTNTADGHQNLKNKGSLALALKTKQADELNRDETRLPP